MEPNDQHGWNADGGMGMTRTMTSSVTIEDGYYIAQCLEVDVASQGTSKHEAVANLREALALYFEPL